MLLCEPERNLAAEQNLIKDPTAYQTSSQTLVTIHDYGNITVPAGGSIVVFSLDTVYAFGVSGGSSVGGGVVAIQVGSLQYVAGYYYDVTYSGMFKHLGCIVWLNAGTYDVSVVGLAPGTTIPGTMGINHMQVGLVQFNDVAALYLASFSGSGSLPLYLTVSQRATPCGNLNQAVFCINICTNGTLGSTFTLTIDGVAHTDMDEQSNPQAGETINGYYIYKLYIPLSVGTQHTITLGLSSVNAYVSVVACPWILAAAGRGHQPLSLSFPQLSTFYTNLGSLFADGPKNCYLGILKAISYGASDYYASGSVASGMLPFSYTFASVNVTGTPLNMDSSTVLGGCIENIGVDIA